MIIIIIIIIFRFFARLLSNHIEFSSSYSCFFVQGGFAMKREKTVIDVDVSEEKQREIVQSLFRERTNAKRPLQILAFLLLTSYASLSLTRYVINFLTLGSVL